MKFRTSAVYHGALLLALGAASSAVGDEEALAAPLPSGPSEPQLTQTPPASPAEISSPAAGTNTENADPNTIAGVEEQQTAQTIQTERDTKSNRLKDYAKQLTKKIQANLVYPNDARQAGLQGTATVSFTILPGGQIQPETLRITVSSGQPKLDASALTTVRLSAPFGPPPREMTVAAALAFGRKCSGARSCAARHHEIRCRF